VLSLVLLLALDVVAPPQIAFISDEQQCAGEAVAAEVARLAGVQAIAATWSDAAKVVGNADVIVLAPTLAQLSLDRGAFMTLIHAQLDTVRAVAPRTRIVIAAPNVSNARGWLNAVLHKRGDAALSAAFFAKANTTRRECATRALEIAKGIQAHAPR
jgi:hypothetical protein